MHQVPSRAAVISAIIQGDQWHPIALGITAALRTFGDQLEAQAYRACGIPDPVVLSVPRTEIEAFALELFLLETAHTGMRITLSRG
jgi:hypothetical protein